jgi:hypothetical protein
VRLCENRPRNSQKRINAMALDQSDLLELVEMFKAGDEGELMRRLLGTMLQQLIDAEATAASRWRRVVEPLESMF